MKFKLFIFALLALMTASCTQEIDILELAEKAGEMITIDVSIPQETRVAYDDATLKLSWEANDQILLVGYDNTNNYVGSSKFSWTGIDNKFTGTPVDGATTYKAYYPASLWLDENGNLQPFIGPFWQRTQNGNNTTGHLKNRLLLFDVEANALNQPFRLSPQSCILKLVLSGIPQEVGALSQIVWTVEIAEGQYKSLLLDVTGVTFSGSENSVTAFLPFDPNEIHLAANGQVSIRLFGAQSYLWSHTVTSEKNYLPGKRYTGIVTGNWKPIINPLDYVAEYNVNPAGTDFVDNLTACDVSGYFNWADALGIDISNYHLPNRQEWCSIVPNNHEWVRFDWDKYDPNVSENVTVQNQAISMTSDYRSPANGTYTSYALRYKGTDMISAWKYQFVSTDYDGFTDNDTHLKITSRNVAPSVTVHEIADEMFWDHDNGNDVVRCFPASGYDNSVGTIVGRGGSCVLWSSTEQSNNANAAAVMYSYKLLAASSFGLGKLAGTPVRLFKNPVEDTTGSTENLLIVGDGDDWLN
ncbi:MAG: fimbrillin family protein [Candidatus Cryptobacteroides sp.]|jgi:hypothetical protein